MPEENKETPATTTEAVKTLIGLAKSSGSNLLVWLVLAVTLVSPVILQQVQQMRSPGGVTYLNPADFHIIGPDRAVVGELVRLTVADYAPTDVIWFWYGDSQSYGPNEANLVFSHNDVGVVSVTCSIIRNGDLYLTQKDIEVLPREDAVVAPVEPVEPDPSPIEPATLTAVGKQMKALAAEHGVPAAVARAIASNLREAADAMGDKTPRALVAETVRLNKQVDLAESANEAIQIMLQTLAEEGLLVSMAQHLAVWNGMADGLDAHANEIP